MNYEMTFAVLFASSFLLSFAFTPVAAKLGEQMGLVDVPGGRRKHARRIPRSGGMALFLGFTIPAALLFVIPQAWLPPRFDPKEPIRLLGLLVCGTIIFAAGLADDKYDLSPKVQLAVQVAVGALSVPFLIIIQRVNNPITNRQVVFPWPIVVALTVFWIVGMIDTVNFLDGLDGLATGVGAILCAILTIHMLRQGQTSVAIVTLIMLGAALGFLPHNFHPAKVFLGSNGSYFLGYSLGALGIIAGAKVATVLAVMSLPILDVAWLIWRRWRAKRSPMSADRWHFHYRLQDLGFSQRQIVLGYYVYSAAAGALALGISTRLYKLIALLILGGIVSFAILWAERVQR